MNEDVNELDALQTLLASDGWQLFVTMADAAHGDAASVRQIDQALGRVDRGDSEAQQDTVTQIRAASRAVQRLLSAPKERIAHLKAEKAKPHGFLSRRRA